MEEILKILNNGWVITIVCSIFFLIIGRSSNDISKPSKQYDYLCERWNVFQIFNDNFEKIGTITINKKWFGFKYYLHFRLNSGDDRFDYKSKIIFRKIKIEESQIREFYIGYCSSKGKHNHNGKDYKEILYIMLDTYKDKKYCEIENITGIIMGTYNRHPDKENPKKAFPRMYSCNIVLTTNDDLQNREDIEEKLKNNFYIENCNELFTNNNPFS